MTEIRTIIDDIYGAWRDRDLDRLASYLPNDFCHTVNFPIALHSLGGVRQGKPAALARLEQAFSEFKVVRFDTSGLMVERDRAAVQIPAHCQHRKTGVLLKTIRAHFWTLEAGWPVTLNEYFDIGQVEDFISAVSARNAV
jgi:ketosteroid isomerase-like protein